MNIYKPSFWHNLNEVLHFSVLSPPSKNENSSQSDVELYDLEVAVVADVILQG